MNKKNILRAFFFIFIIGLGTGILLGYEFYSLFWGENGILKGLGGDTVSILFMGTDGREDDENYRSDTMILGSLQRDSEQLALVSIPRDTHIKTASGKNIKINEVNFTEGPEGACEEVGELLDTPVQYYVMADFEGFKEIIDVLGGVHINVESAMQHSDPVNPGLAIDIAKGYQYMDGQTALNYVRYRGGATADIGRTERQQEFIRSATQEWLTAKNIFKLPRLLHAIKDNIDTNLSLPQLAVLAFMGRNVQPDEIAAQTLPGYPFTDKVSGVNYWEIDRNKAGTILRDLFAGKSFEVFQTAGSKQI